MSDFSFNIVCTTVGRPSLPRLINSFKDQLSEKDFFTIISDVNHDYVSEVISSYKTKFKIIHIKNDGDQLGKYGHPLLNKYLNNLNGDFIMFADDDDYYVEDAFEYIKKTVLEKKLYVFRHDWYGTINWAQPNFEIGNVGKCLGAIPNIKEFPKFREDVFGDCYFYFDLSQILEYEFVDKIIYKIRETQ